MVSGDKAIRRYGTSLRPVTPSVAVLPGGIVEFTFPLSVEPYIAATDPSPPSSETLADKAAGFHPMAKPVKQSVTEHPGPQKHGADAMPMKALRLGWSRE